jgi:transglutaminase-like putative cysteine protease
MNPFLAPGKFVDSNNPAVIQKANELVNARDTDIKKAIKLYHYVRDTFRYNPYALNLTEEGLKASNLLTRNYGYCIEKACLLSALARVCEIPSRLGFAKVTNHIGTKRIEEILGTNVLVFHGYSELFLNGKWVKATPSFNAELCYKFRVEPLGFDGLSDSVFQQFDSGGNLFMEYLYDYGLYADLPREKLIKELKLNYPKVFDKMIGNCVVIEQLSIKI